MKLHANVLGSGKPMLILHGFLGMGDNWKTLGSRFADEEGFQVHLIDQRNHGRSPHTEEFSYEIMAEDIKDYCDQNDLDDIVLIGHSMGGKTAMHVAIEYPQLLDALIVVDIAPKYYPPHHQTILEGLTMLQNTKLSSRRTADEKLKDYIKDLGIRQFLLKNLYWKEKGKLAFRMNLPVLKDKIETVGQALADEAEYGGRTLFIKGGKSNYIKDDDKNLLKKHFPKSQLLTIKDTDHWVHAEKPDAFFKGVMGFLQN